MKHPKLKWFASAALVLAASTAQAEIVCSGVCMIKGPTSKGLETVGFIPKVPVKGSDHDQALRLLLDQCWAEAQARDIQFSKGNPAFTVVFIHGPSGQGAPVCQDPAAEKARRDKILEAVSSREENQKLIQEVAELKATLTQCGCVKSSSLSNKQVEDLGYAVKKVETQIKASSVR